MWQKCARSSVVCKSQMVRFHDVACGAHVDTVLSHSPRSICPNRGTPWPYLRMLQGLLLVASASLGAVISVSSKMDTVIAARTADGRRGHIILVAAGRTKDGIARPSRDLCSIW